MPLYVHHQKNYTENCCHMEAALVKSIVCVVAEDEECVESPHHFRTDKGQILT